MEHISKIYGDKVIFDDITCGIHQGDKIGIIGINGTGKNHFSQDPCRTGGAGWRTGDPPERPAAVFPSPASRNFPEGETVLSLCCPVRKERRTGTPETDARMVLNRLGIADHEEKIDHLSGGQKKRVALAAVLVNPADVLILDEPTNHLDNEMAAWLEEYLNAYKGAVIMVTHDRYFLDRVTNKILEISHGKIYMYEAKYSRFLELKAEREEMEAAFLEKTEQYPEDGDGMGEKGLPPPEARNREPAWNVWKRGRTQRGRRAGSESGDRFCGDQNGKENHRASPHL